MSTPDERRATLRKLGDSGLTASQIAEELGGVSRNAVIGKAHRPGLKARPSPVKPNDKTEIDAAPDASVAAAPKKPRAPEPVAEPVARPAPALAVTPPVAPAPPPASAAAPVAATTPEVAPAPAPSHH